MTDNKDEMTLKRAREIVEDTGASLTDAMIQAEIELTPAREIPASYTVTIPLRPRVSKWVLDEFGGHPKHSIEDRLGAYLAIVLSRTRVSAARDAEEGQDVTDAGAVTLRRDKFQRKVPTQ